MATAPDRAGATSTDRESVKHESTAMRLPTFLVIGAAKSGTIGLCEDFRMYPLVFVSEPKEPQFLPIEFKPEQGIGKYAALRRCG
jgi:hypothetical protein